MKVTMVMVTSINGMLTNGDNSNITLWTSKEDLKFYKSMLAENSLLVFGSGTYEALKNSLKSRPGKLRVVLTRQPLKYKADEIPDQLEFINVNPKELINQLEHRGYKQMLLVSGSEINRLFLEAGVVNDLYLTLEPKLFGYGKPFVATGKLEASLVLKESTLLNEQGTLLLHYEFI